MDGVVSNEGRKRRLPLWMVGVAAADKVRKCGRGVGEGNASKCLLPQSTAGHGKEVSVQALEVEDSSLMVNCQSRRRERRIFKKDDETGIDKRIQCEVESALPVGGIQTRRRKKRKAKGFSTEGSGKEIHVVSPSEDIGDMAGQEVGSRKRRKAKSLSFKSTNQSDVSLPNEDDEDLTVEDLMTIAEEIINDHEDMAVAPQGSSKEEGNEEAQLAAITSSRIEAGGFGGSPRGCKNSAMPKETSFHNVTDKSTGEGTVINLHRMGDPAQDMLDLFLGPLLEKPKDKEMRVDLITEDKTSAFASITQNQNAIPGVEPAPMMKKKSSLKDKVALFLD